MAYLDELIGYCFDGQQLPLAAEFAQWVQDSRRFRAFAHENRAKIRAKLRSVRDEGGLLDLRAELLAAAVLLREERFQVAYETYAAGRQRGPDFTVTFKTHTPFNVEVRRLRSSEGAGSAEAALAGPQGKLMAVICDKIGQMPPSMVNLLWLAVDGELGEDDVTVAMASLRRRADAKDEAFFTHHGFADAASFLQQQRRLSGIVIRQVNAAAVWLNPPARHPAPRELVNALRRLGGSA